MRRALQGYHARGQHVLLGHPEMDVSARVEKQLTGGPGALFTVVLDIPIGREDYEAALGLFEGQARKVFDQAAREGRLDAEGALTRITAPWAWFSLDVVRSPRGTLVEYQTEDPHHVTSFRDTPGRIVGRQEGVGGGGENVVYVELFEPLSYWQVPSGITVEHAKPGFWSSTAYFLSGTIRKALAQTAPDILGRLGAMKKVEGTEHAHHGAYALEEPRPVKEVRALIRPVLGSWVDTVEEELPMVLYFVLPLWHGGGLQRGHFRPMREDLAKGLEVEVFEGAEWLEGLQ